GINRIARLRIWWSPLRSLRLGPDGGLKPSGNASEGSRTCLAHLGARRSNMAVGPSGQSWVVPEGSLAAPVTTTRSGELSALPRMNFRFVAHDSLEPVSPAVRRVRSSARRQRI